MNDKTTVVRGVQPKCIFLELEAAGPCSAAIQPNNTHLLHVYSGIFHPTLGCNPPTEVVG